MSLPERWAIKRTCINRTFVNDYFNKLYGKNRYSGGGSYKTAEGFIVHNYLHFPKIKGSKVVLGHVHMNYKEITVEQLKASQQQPPENKKLTMEQKKPDYSKLPKSWGVQLPKDSTKRQLFFEKVKPLLGGAWFSYNSYEAYYGINKEGGKSVDSSNMHFEKVYTIEEFIQLTEGEPEFVLPEEWYVTVTKENQKVLTEWRGCDIPIGAITGMTKLSKEWNDEPDSGWNNEITFEQFKKYVLKEEPFVLPEKWYIKPTASNEKALISWRGCEFMGNRNNAVLGSDKFWHTVEIIPTLGQEISFDQFQQYVLKQSPITKTETMPTTNMQEKVTIPQEFFDGLIKDGTTKQRELVKDNVDFFDRTTTKAFVKKFYDEEVMASCQWKKKLEVAFPFVKEEVIDLSTGKLDGRILFADKSFTPNLIAVRFTGKYAKKGFALNPEFYWSISNEEGNTTLIPERKKK